MNEEEKKLERVKGQLEVFLAATASKDQNVLTMASLAAALLVIATFNERLLPLNGFVIFLLTLLLLIIPVLLFTHLIASDRAGEKAIKNIEEITGSSMPRVDSENSFDLWSAYLPYLASGIITLVIVALIILIWTNHL